MGYPGDIWSYKEKEVIGRSDHLLLAPGARNKAPAIGQEVTSGRHKIRIRHSQLVIECHGGIGPGRTDEDIKTTRQLLRMVSVVRQVPALLALRQDQARHPESGRQSKSSGQVTTGWVTLRHDHPSVSGPDGSEHAGQSRDPGRSFR
jgi:hypothetical protein